MLRIADNPVHGAVDHQVAQIVQRAGIDLGLRGRPPATRALSPFVDSRLAEDLRLGQVFDTDDTFSDVWDITAGSTGHPDVLPEEPRSSGNTYRTGTSKSVSFSGNGATVSPRAILPCNKALELLDDRCLVQYFLSDNALVCCALSKKAGVVVRSVPVGSMRIFGQKIQHLVTDFTSRPKGTELLPKIQRALTEFYDLLLRPVKSVIEGARSLVVIPAGALYNVPFACLFDGECYVIERHLISYLPHAALLTLPSLSTFPRSWAGFGDPCNDLRATQNELALIAPLFTEARTYTGVHATPENLWAALQQAEVVQIAARVSHDPKTPFTASFQAHNGQHTTEVPCGDVVNHDVNAQVAVLRCCYTGATQPWFGGEVAGMWACFLLAGCRAVLASPWEVYESPEVSQLVVRFYQIWIREGKPPVESLALAQRESLKAGVYPAMWAFPFLVGNM